MMSISELLKVADAYKEAAGLDKDSTVSSRVFNDGKKLTALREGSDIVTGRYNAAFVWFYDHWPEGKAMPKTLTVFKRAA